MSHGREIISLVAQRQDLEQFRKKNWLGTFEEYLDLVRQQPAVSRNAFERVYDMIMSAAKGYGIEKRVLSLHGPVGSSKSTIARLMKRGMERYSGTDGGALYTL